MKKLLLFLILLSFNKTLISQNERDEPEQNLNEMMSQLDVEHLDYNVIYDRTSKLSDLINFNEERNVATLRTFEQGLQDLYKSSNKSLFESYKKARNYYPNKPENSQVAIGVINAKFYSLNYNDSIVEGSSGLKLINNVFQPIEGKKAFNAQQVLIFAPLKNFALGEVINFSFKNELFFQESDRRIKDLEVDFGLKTNEFIYKNGNILKTNIPVSYRSSGYKKLTFKVTFDDGKTLTTYGKLYVKVPNLSSQNKSALSLIDNVTGFESDIPFKGYDEATPKYGKLDYRIYYHTSNGNTEKKLKKPIIIIDGFDPGDGRKIEDSDSPKPAHLHRSIDEMMVYGPDNTKMIPELRAAGFDVIVVNFPNYTTSGVQIDGGADFIERNALTIVTLIKEINTRLADENDGFPNEKRSKLVIVGPSMGGQISRYALSYMEKKLQETDLKEWKHNTRLWISVDSPHLGANIPMGVQCLLNVLKDNTDSVGAADFVDNWLGSPAAKQQLIEQYSGQKTVTFPPPFVTVVLADIKSDYLDGKTVSQGFNVNRGHPFFIQYYNNLFNNGLANSKGYPQETRSIAIVNGSLLGNNDYDNPYVNLGVDFSGTILADQFASHGTKALKIEGDANIIGHIVTLETYFMASLNNRHKLSYFKKKVLGGWRYYNRYGTNINPRGNMDNISGGWFPAQRDVAQSVLAESSGEAVLGDITNWSIVVNDWNVNNLDHVSSFIPTISALGFKNPDISWTQSLKRNLSCTNEIPFDSYFGPDKNEPHTSFTVDSYNWLREELAGRFQDPRFPPSANSLTGSDEICLGETKVYAFGSCYSPGDISNWTVSSNLSIVSSTDNSVTIQSPSSTRAQGWVKAEFENGEEVQKTIWVGRPSSPSHITGPENVNTGALVTYTGHGGHGMDSYEWWLPGPYTVQNPFNLNADNWQVKPNADRVTQVFTGLGEDNGYVQFMGRNRCGLSGAALLSVEHTTTGGPGGGGITGQNESNVLVGGTEESTDLNAIIRVYPNPADNVVNINIKQDVHLHMKVILLDNFGKIIADRDFQGNSLTIDTSKLGNGFYVLKVFSDDSSITKKLIIKH